MAHIIVSFSAFRKESERNGKPLKGKEKMRSDIADYDAVVEAASKFTRSVAEGSCMKQPQH